MIHSMHKEFSHRTAFSSVCWPMNTLLNTVLFDAIFLTSVISFVNCNGSKISDFDTISYH